MTTKPTPAADHKPLRPAADWDDDEDDTPYGDPAKVKNEGVLDSLGKAVSSPIIEAAENEEPDARARRESQEGTAAKRP